MISATAPKSSIMTIGLSPLIVEVHYPNGSWFQGTVCDDSFNANAALVACRSYNSAVRSASFSSFTWQPTTSCRYGFGSASNEYQCRFILDDVTCNASSYSSLESCTHSSFFNHNCGDSEHIHLICNT